MLHCILTSLQCLCQSGHLPVSWTLVSVYGISYCRNILRGTVEWSFDKREVPTESTTQYPISREKCREWLFQMSMAPVHNYLTWKPYYKISKITFWDISIGTSAMNWLVSHLCQLNSWSVSPRTSFPSCRWHWKAITQPIVATTLCLLLRWSWDPWPFSPVDWRDHWSLSTTRVLWTTCDRCTSQLWIRIIITFFSWCWARCMHSSIDVHRVWQLHRGSWSGPVATTYSSVFRPSQSQFAVFY